MKKIAVIGANGYIARNLVFVLKRDYPNVGVKLYGIEETHFDGYENYVTVDMTNKESVKQIDLSCDIVFMFVGRTGSVKGFDDYDSFIDINEKALLNLLSEYRNQKSNARIVFPSTRLVYKGSSGLKKEDAEKEFKTIYSMTKYACEKYLEQFHRVFGIQYTVLRICIPYGSLIPSASSYGTIGFMLSKAKKGENVTIYGDGRGRRTLTYIYDLCVTMIEAAFSEQCSNDVFNVGGDNLSLKEMAELIALKFGVEIDYVPWPDVELKIESGDTVFNSEKLDSLITISRKMRFAEWVRNNADSIEKN